jgi:hypothetical protein
LSVNTIAQEFADIFAMFEHSDVRLRERAVARHGRAAPSPPSTTNRRRRHGRLDGRAGCNAEKMSNTSEVLCIAKRPHEQQLRRGRGRVILRSRVGAVGNAYRARCAIMSLSSAEQTVVAS